MKILIIRLSAIGDTIHCLPAVSMLRRRLPGCQISWLVEPPSAPLIEGNPCVDKTFVIPRKAWLGALGRPALWMDTAAQLGGLFAELRAQRFDWAVDFQGLLKSAVCAYASGAPRRLGFQGAREGAGLLMTDFWDVGDYFSPDVHVVEHNLALARALCRAVSADASEGEPDFPLPPVPEASQARMAALFPSGGESGAMDGDTPMAVLIPGTTWQSKIWPVDKWCRLAEKLVQERGLRLCLVGSAAEQAVNGEIAACVRKRSPQAAVIDLSGATTITDLIALFRLSSVVVGADTGPLHLAAAVGTPSVVGVFGSTPWRRNGPYGKNCRSASLHLWCQPCFRKTCPLSTLDCLKRLEPETVLAEIDSLRPPGP